MSTDPATTDEQSTGRWSDLKRIPGRVRENPFEATVVLGAVVIAVLGFGLALSLTHDESVVEIPKTPLEEALEALDEERFDDARRLAGTIQADDGLSFLEAGGPLFIHGAVWAKEAADTFHPLERRARFLVAAGYLKNAADRAFPDGREAEGQWLLASSLYHAGRFDDALPLLTDALSRNQQRRAEIYHLLANAALRMNTPDQRQALKFNRLHLAQRGLSPAERDQAYLDQSRIYFELNELDNSTEALRKIPAEAALQPDVYVMQARLMMGEAANQTPEQATQFLQQAIDTLRLAQSRTLSQHEANRASQYLIGVCYRRLTDIGAELDYSAAEKQLDIARKLNFNTPEGFAATLETAEVQRVQDRLELSLTTYQELLKDDDDTSRFNNPWVRTAELQQRLVEAYVDYRDEKRFDLAVGLTDALAPIVAEPRALRIQAETQRLWGEHFAGQADSQSLSLAEVTRAEARDRFRRAADEYARLADFRQGERDYAEVLFNSARNYLEGHNFVRALEVYDKYLEHCPRDARPAALVDMGQALLATGNYEKCLKPLGECIEFYPKDPVTYQARLLAGKAHLEAGRLEQAKALLDANLSGELSPESAEWRDSQFLLGEVLMREASQHETQSRIAGVDSDFPEQRKEGLKELRKSSEVFAKAINELNKAVGFYPDDPQAVESLYMLAEAHRHRAKLPARRLPYESIETTRNALRNEYAQSLTQSLDIYARLQEKLNQQLEQQRELTPVEQSILRNCYLSRGSVLFELERYDDAIQAYSAATIRYLNDPCSLEAFVQMASCYRLKGEANKARGQLEQAKVVLRRIPADANFTSTTRYTRDEWVKHLDWLSAL